MKQLIMTINMTRQTSIGRIYVCCQLWWRNETSAKKRTARSRTAAQRCVLQFHIFTPVE